MNNLNQAIYIPSEDKKKWAVEGNCYPPDYLSTLENTSGLKLGKIYSLTTEKEKPHEDLYFKIEETGPIRGMSKL